MSPEKFLLTIKLVFAFLIVLGMVLFLVRPLIRMWREKPELDLLMPDYSARLDELGEQEELEIPTDEQAPDRMELLDQAREDPRATATLVQKWLRERK